MKRLDIGTYATDQFECFIWAETLQLVADFHIFKWWCDDSQSSRQVSPLAIIPTMGKQKNYLRLRISRCVIWSSDQEKKKIKPNHPISLVKLPNINHQLPNDRNLGERKNVTGSKKVSAVWDFPVSAAAASNISCHAQLSTKLLDSVERDWTKFLNMLLWKEYM